MSKENWYFTFGSNHYDADGRSLGNAVCVVEGTFGEAREKMVEARGDVWAFQYKTAEQAGVERFGLRFRALEDIALVEGNSYKPKIVGVEADIIITDDVEL